MSSIGKTSEFIKFNETCSLRASCKPVLGLLSELEGNLSKIFSAELSLCSGLQLPHTGGKRIRPALVLLSSLFGRGPCPRVKNLAAAVEILHLATLIHDDILDNSETRHGRPTVNKLLGEKAAILSGDYIYAVFLEQTANLGGPVLAVLSGALKGMVQAEVAQQLSLFSPCLSEKDYLKRTSLKTGCFFSCCCKLGGQVAGAEENTIQILERFGRLLGIAFQIKDDLLDFTGEAVSMGKPVAQDLRQGIITLPVIHVLKCSPEKNKIRGLIEKKELSDDAVDLIIREMVSTGSLSFAEKMVERYARIASRMICALPENEVQGSFSQMVNYIMTRNY